MNKLKSCDRTQATGVQMLTLFTLDLCCKTLCFVIKGGPVDKLSKSGNRLCKTNLHITTLKTTLTSAEIWVRL